MRTLAISDLHFGAWTGDPVLSRPFARERLGPLLDDVDELVLLGDVFDFLFSSVQRAFEQADAFFEMVGERMRGKRVVFLAGNHDHHIAVRALRSQVEARVATGEWDSGYRSFFQAFMDRRLTGVECEIAYPYYLVDDVLLAHGHWLDAHMSGSLPNRILTRGIWAVAGGRPEDELTLEDYEAVIVPLTELLFTVAQLPRGTAAQMSFLNQFERLGRLARVAAGLRGLARQPRPPARACSPADPPPLALSAYAQVVRNLCWDQLATQFVFAHTHQALNGRSVGGLRFWNTGSWIYEPSLGSREAYDSYLCNAWPGTAVLVDSERESPELVETLQDQNPLYGETAELRPALDQFSERVDKYDARLSRTAA